MPLSLQNVLSKIPLVPNQTNATLLDEFQRFLKSAGLSEHRIRNEVSLGLQFAKYLGGDKTFLDISKKQEITDFLDTKRKPNASSQDPWKSTWNDYLDRLRHFFRWLYNQRGKEDLTDWRDWQTPAFLQIRKQKIKRKSTYTAAEVWRKEELQMILKYCKETRNKLAIAMLWDMNGRNSEATSMRLENIYFTESYAAGEVPPECKTGSGPVLSIPAFPYLRDWLNSGHPDPKNGKARVLTSLKDGTPIGPEALWSMMQNLKKRIIRLLNKGVITDPEERKQLEYIIRTKSFRPYAIRHSSIRYDSNMLPEFALRKKVRWSMNSKMPGRYMSNEMDDDLKKRILEREGVVVENGGKPKSTSRVCGKCQLVNAIEMRFCTKCSYPLNQEAMEELRTNETQALRVELAKMKKQLDRMTEACVELGAEIYEMVEVPPQDKNKDSKESSTGKLALRSA